ncbi:AraC family transcriptional regulator [Vibrio harveyi]|uniref:helix-turn-helix domain-containing protein n=1 Tax=Vibrio harveyi TaxID=669 RepID=UPI000841B553|nr:AraC family transcriptional regulator [Vibrio harveyi]ODM58215.1 AraC family transcriptional regulator [Vibrio harveyi]
MTELIKAYWIGDAPQSLPNTFRSVLESTFTLIKSGDDVSVLSDRAFTYFFYCQSSEHHRPQKSLLTLCKNLDKKLIVIHQGQQESNLPPEHIVAEYHRVEMDSTYEWISQIKLKYFSPENFDEQFLSSESALTKSGKSNFVDVVHYIANNVHKDLREEEAAALCHYSPNYFSKLFHRKVGMCFRDYITEKRISLAKKMLTEEDSMKIAYIAYQCGYRDVSYFSRIFKKKTGLSPASYRQQF